jgi:hypothetical protein
MRRESDPNPSAIVMPFLLPSVPLCVQTVRAARKHRAPVPPALRRCEGSGQDDGIR